MRIRHKTTMAVGALAAAACSNAADRCANETGDGSYNAPISVDSISASDVQNGARAAWEKIAAAAAVHGPNMGPGLVSLTIYTTILGKRVAIPGTFPIENTGSQSFQASILQYMGIPLPGGKDPSPCDPQKNACCEECSAMFGLIDPSDIFRGGFLSKSRREDIVSQKNGLSIVRRRLAA